VQQFLRADQERKFPPGSVTCANGWTALLVAAKHGRTAVVEALLGAKVDIEATVTTTASTAIIQASAYFHPDVVKLLLGAGAKVYRADKQGEYACLVASIWLKKTHQGYG
jgi:ankyrin repeat protein